MEWKIWITWWITFYIRCSRLFWIYLKKYGEETTNPLLGIYVTKKKKKEIRTTFEIKGVYYLELLTLKTVKLLGSNQKKIDKNKNGEKFSHLEIAKIV